MSHSTEKLITILSNGNEEVLLGYQVHIDSTRRTTWSACSSGSQAHIPFTNINQNLESGILIYEMLSFCCNFFSKSLSEIFVVFHWFRIISVLEWFYGERVLQVKLRLKREEVEMEL